MTWVKKVQTDAGALECLPLTSDRFPDIEEVFGERGTARRCFCMHWRRPDGGFEDTRDNRAHFADITEQGPPPGLVGYLDGRPVGWVQVGPIDDFPTILRSRLFKPVDDTPTWSINCFVVKVGHRRRGVGLGLLTAAVGYAKHCGARVIEAYPVDGDRSSAVDYFTGTMGMFDSHGFVELIRRKDTRPIVRLRVS
jgi:GNAT superfamily N-acetyltransferase